MSPHIFLIQHKTFPHDPERTDPMLINNPFDSKENSKTRMKSRWLIIISLNFPEEDWLFHLINRILNPGSIILS